MPKPRSRGLLLAVALSVLAGSTTAAAEPVPAYRDPSRPAPERAADLVSRMTLEEKAAQLNSSNAPAIPRLGVRAYGWWNEALHGVAREQTAGGSDPEDLTNTTSYPVSLSMGSTWDPQLVHQVSGQIADEAREVVKDNTLDLNFYSPTINLSRDPRWGRNDETYSEDPNLTAQLGAQFVNGMEGKDTSGRPLPEGGGYLKTSTTIKHFAANNSEFNRTTGSSNVDERSLREYYTKQFRDVVAASDPGSIMTSYNRVNGEPTSASPHLMDTLARKTFGFGGFFTSDCDSVFEIQDGHHWQPPGYDRPVNEVERNAVANAAGEDLNCNQGYHDEHNFGNALPTAVQQGVRTPNGTYNEHFVDASLVRLFTTRIRLGEFDPPEANPWVQAARARVPKGSWENSDANGAVTETPQRLELARKAAAESLVLLKNDGGQLPIRVPASGPFKVAVVGDHANPAEMYLGGYSSTQGPAGQAKSVNGYQGVKAAIQRINPQAQVDFLPGTDPRQPGRPNADSIARSAGYDAAIVYGGTDESTAKEEQDRPSLQLPAPQTDLINGVAARNPNTSVYLETVGQVDVTAFEPHVRSILWSSYNGQRKGEALADVLLGRKNPSGHLPFTWYRGDDQLPPIGDYRIRPAADTPGRTYQYFRGPVSYPFGHGLSYTSFQHGDLRLDREQVAPDGTVGATASVTNRGTTAGTDVAQLYATTPSAPAEAQRPAQRLITSQKVSLQPGETKQVRFRVNVADLAFFDEQANRFQVPEGEYGLRLAASSADPSAQEARFRVAGEAKPKPTTLSVTPQAAGDEPGSNAGRVSYPVGAEVDARPTVALSDGTLRGYVAEGSAAPLPPGAVQYASNRPDVVRVDPGGRIRTAAKGTATVTATYREGTTTVTKPFVIHVN